MRTTKLSTLRMPFGHYRGEAMETLATEYIAWVLEHGFTGSYGELEKQLEAEYLKRQANRKTVTAHQALHRRN